jgi:type I restriction enzyme S subunit
MWASIADTQKYAVASGDLLICEGGEVGRAAVVGAVPQHCILQNSLHRVRSRSGDVRFLKFVLECMASSGWFDVLCNRATIAHFTSEKLKAARIPWPPLATQRRIADLLDGRTAAVDVLIEKKQRLTALLSEKRQALITQAVTKGFDPTVPMKDSGVASVGKVPSHWALVTLRRVGRVGQGDAFAHDRQGRESGEFPWFKVADMNRPGNEIEMVSADNFVDRMVVVEARATIFPAGAVIFPRVGAALLTNKRRVLTRPSLIDDNTYAVVPNDRIRSRFLYWSLLLVDMASICSAGLVPTVSFSGIKDLPVALPPIAEQDLIVQRVEADCAALDALLASTRRSVEKLREYRQALITAAVTGKIDVRDEVPL